MNKIFLFFLIVCLFTLYKGVGQSPEENPLTVSDKMASLVDSVLWARRNSISTDILSRKVPEITRDQAYTFQLKMLKKELAAGKKLIGYKMGGTAVSDPDKYDGFIISKSNN